MKNSVGASRARWHEAPPTELPQGSEGLPQWGPGAKNGLISVKFSGYLFLNVFISVKFTVFYSISSESRDVTDWN